MQWSLDIQPLVPLPLIAALALAGLATAVTLMLRHRRGGVLRLAALASLVLAMLNPVAMREDRDILDDIAVLVVDRSQSQTLAARPGQTDAAEAQVSAAIEALPDTELRTVTVTSGATADDDGTRAFTALARALADVPPERYAGAVLITDGQVHDAAPGVIEPGYAAPLHGLLTGDPDELDRRIEIKAAPRFAMVGQRQTVRFTVVDHGARAPAPVMVTLAIDGAPATTVTVTAGVESELDFTVDHGGPNVLELAAAELPGELTVQNNRAVIVTEGIRDRLRVLLISGEPHPGERTWRNLLKADASVDLVHFTILRPPEKQDGTPINELSLIAFPTRELFVEKLAEFDLIIFDRYQSRGVLPQAYIANIANYVENGGAVLVASGPDYAGPASLYQTPLSMVLPAAPTGEVTTVPFRARVTERGRRHPVAHGLPGAGANEPSWGRWFRLIDAEARLGDTVMSGPDDKPLMVLARIGQGRVAQILSDHAWLWTRGYEGGGPQAELLRRLAHWLMKEPELEEEALAARQDRSRLVIERRTMADAAEPVTVTLPSGATETVELAPAGAGLWSATLAAREAGLHRLADGTLTAVAAVGSPDPKELAEVHATPAIVAGLADPTGGAVRWLSRSGGAPEPPRFAKVRPGRAMAGAGWLGLKANGAYRVTAIAAFPLFSSLLALAALLGLASLMWYREGR